MFSLNPHFTLAASFHFNMFFVASIFTARKKCRKYFTVYYGLIEICGAPLGYPKIPSECKCIFWVFEFSGFFFDVLVAAVARRC